MKKIAIFSGYYLPHLGGVERYTYNLANKMKQMGYEIVIVSLRYDDSLEEVEQLDYAKIYRLPTHKLFVERYPIVNNNSHCKKMLKMIEEENIDSIILQTRFWTSSYIGSKFATKNNIPVCLIEHGSTHFTVNNKILDFFGAIYEHKLTNAIKKNVKDFYGVSKKCVEWLKHFDIEAKGVFYNSINTEEAEVYNNNIQKDSEKISITYVGRLIPEKGVLKLISIFKDLQKKYNIELNIAGQGPLLDKIKQDNKDNINIHILGMLSHDEVMNLLAKTDIFINPSSFPEGLPTTILEAGIMECAVVATPMGGTAEILENENIGLICGFEENEIKEKLVELLNDKDKREKLSKNIKKQVIEKFSWDATAKKVVNTIKFK